MILRWLIVLLLVPALSPADEPSSRVGQPLEITGVFIPGGRVQPVPRRDRTPPLVVRLLEVRPAAGGLRYDFEVTGLEPGEHELADHLEPVDPSEPATIPSLPLLITTGLPAAEAPRPHPLPPGELPSPGGYRNALVAFAVVWVLGLVAILAWRKRKQAPDPEEAPPPDLAARLQPLVEAASAGTIDDAGRARLDRLLIGHWRQRIPEIADLPPSHALTALRRHPEASPLLLALERWLHAPGSDHHPELAALLEPYRSAAPPR